VGIVSTQDALRRAQELDLDLVEVAPQANPPVCRIMDYGKYKYERDIRQKEARKKQSKIEVKEIKFRPKIDPHDYATKKGHVERFLRAGARVKVTIMFRGREMAHTELGRKILDRLVEDLTDLAVVEAAPKQDGRNMIMVIAPTKKPPMKAESPAQADAPQTQEAQG
jgi:translation initiation factor IF-3